jgi:hypothetical protein
VAVSRKLLLCIRRLLLDNRPYVYEPVIWKNPRPWKEKPGHDVRISVRID